MIRLGTGHYLSPIGAVRRTPVATLIETTYGQGTRLPRHRHEFPYLVLVVNGVLQERAMRRDFRLACGSIVFNEAAECHDNEVLSRRARCLNVELADSFLGRLAEEGLSPRESVVYAHAGAVGGALGRLYAATIDPGPDIEVEEALVTALAALWRRRPGRSDAGAPWVARVVEMLREADPRGLSLSALARETGVNRAHLCRGFRAATGCTIGDYARSLRIARALASVVGSDAPLGNVAAREGFADQSHMTRAFAASLGRTPRRVRRAASGANRVQDSVQAAPSNGAR